MEPSNFERYCLLIELHTIEWIVLLVSDFQLNPSEFESRVIESQDGSMKLDVKLSISEWKKLCHELHS